MRKVAGRLRLDLAQYRELEAFAAFASDLDRASRDQLDRGARLVELLKQPNYSPYPVEEQVVSVWAGTEGKLDDVPVGDVRRFEAEFLQYLRHEHKGIYDAIRRPASWNDDIVDALDEAIAEFKQKFLATDDGTLVGQRGRGRGDGGGRGGPARRSSASSSRARPSEADDGRPGTRPSSADPHATSMKKITKAMELVATSRIAKAQAAGRGVAAVRRGDHRRADGAGVQRDASTTRC